jgi:hypothetical protein
MKRNLGIRKAKQEARRIVRKVIAPERLAWLKWKRKMLWLTVASGLLGAVLGKLVF